MSLTDLKARQAKAKAKQYKLPDGNGLHLLIRPTGTKVWQFRYEHAGSEKTLTIGKYPAVTISEAHKARDVARLQLDQGIDPSTAKQVARASSVAATGNIFEDIAREWHKTNSGKWSEVHINDVLRSLEKHVFPRIGKLPIGDLKAPAILNVHQAIEKDAGIETARRVRQRISAIFEFGIAKGVCADDPASKIKTLIQPLPKVSPQPAITDLTALRAMLRALEAMPAHPVTKLAMRFIALTVVRPGTLHTTPWAEFEGIDDKTTDPVWKIPASRMKMDREHWVPLPSQAVDVIEALRPISGAGPFAFPNDRFAHRPMTENALLYLIKRAGYGGQHCPHGWRASFNTIMSEKYQGDKNTDSALDVMLAHASNKGPYNRAMVLDRRRELAQEWADILLNGFPPADSLTIGRRR